MISCNRGKIDVDGIGEDLIAEFGIITHTLIKMGLPKNILDEIYAVASLPTENIGEAARMAEVIKVMKGMKE